MINLDCGICGNDGTIEFHGRVFCSIECFTIFMGERYGIPPHAALMILKEYITQKGE